MKKIILFACAFLVIAKLTPFNNENEQPAASQSLHTAAVDEGRREKNCLDEVMAEVAHYGLVSEQVFTLQTGAAPFEKLKETLLNL